MSFSERLKEARRILDGVRGHLPLMWSRAVEDWLGVREPGRSPWRVGSHVARNIYDADDQDIGRMDTAELAALVVVAVNADFETERLRRQRDADELESLKRRAERAEAIADARLAESAPPGLDDAATRQWVQSRGFYEMMQAYRNAPVTLQKVAAERFAHIQQRIVDHVRAQLVAAEAHAMRLPKLDVLLSTPSRTSIDIGHIPWLVKDFDVLYRIAEDVAASVIYPDRASPPLRQLRAQLDRLKPAMEQIEAVKARLRGSG